MDGVFVQQIIGSGNTLDSLTINKLHFDITFKNNSKMYLVLIIEHVKIIINPHIDLKSNM